MRNTIFAALALGAGSLALAACGSEEAPAQQAPADTVEGFEVSNARLILPAVAGNPAALYFDLSYNGDRGIALRGLEVEGAANAALHEMVEWAGKMDMNEMGPMAMQPGDNVSFEPGGKHGMVFELPDTVKAGDTVTARIVFARGNKHAFEAEVRDAGDDRN